MKCSCIQILEGLSMSKETHEKNSHGIVSVITFKKWGELMYFSKCAFVGYFLSSLSRGIWDLQSRSGLLCKTTRKKVGESTRQVAKEDPGYYFHLAFISFYTHIQRGVDLDHKTSSKLSFYSNQASTSSLVKLSIWVTALLSHRGIKALFPGREKTKIRQFSVWLLNPASQ